MSDDRSYQGENPFREGAVTAAPSAAALVAVEQQRAVAEVQARMLLARRFPRDQIQAVDAILRDCTRLSLAQSALYSYARGGAEITGPTIRLAEAVAQRWGNIASGFKELARRNGYSEVVAYAWDLESGFYDERQFQVRHWRDTRGGGHPTTDERDIYELVANAAQRRKRAVLLSVIPGDVIEIAVAECEKTLRAKVDVTPDGIRKMLEIFEQIGVSRGQVEQRCQCHAEAIRPAQIVQLRKIYASIKDGLSEPGDWFQPVTAKAATAAEFDEFARPSNERPKMDTLPERATAIDPEPKPPEGRDAMSADGGAGNSSEADPAERGGGSASEVAEAGDPGGETDGERQRRSIRNEVLARLQDIRAAHTIEQIARAIHAPEKSVSAALDYHYRHGSIEVDRGKGLWWFKGELSLGESHSRPEQPPTGEPRSTPTANIGHPPAPAGKADAPLTERLALIDAQLRATAEGGPGPLARLYVRQLKLDQEALASRLPEYEAIAKAALGGMGE